MTGPLLVMVDISKSMSIEDPVSRWEKAKKFLSESIVKKLGKKYTLRFFPFASGSERVSLDNIMKFSPSGEKTDIGLGLQEVHNELNTKGLTGIILISDGAHNGENNPLEISKKINLPVYTIGVGDPTKYVDIEVNEVKANDFVFIDTPVKLNVTLKCHGFSGRRVSVLLKKGKEVISSKKIRINKSFLKETFVSINQKGMGKKRGKTVLFFMLLLSINRSN